MPERNFIDILDDLIKQSEKEKSHYYTSAVLKSCKQLIVESNLIFNLILTDGYKEGIDILIKSHLNKQQVSK